MDKEYSLEELLGFLDYGGKKGLFNSTTAQSRKTACKKVLSGLEEDEKADLRNLDFEGAFARFMNKSGDEYTPDSLKVYKARVKTALADFIKWKEDPAKFKPSTPQRTRARKAGGEQSPRSSRRTEKYQGGGEFADTGFGGGGDTSAAPLVFPIPVRDRSVIVRISNLPNDLTEGEAEKISIVLASLSGYLMALTKDDKGAKESADD